MQLARKNQQQEVPVLPATGEKQTDTAPCYRATTLVVMSRLEF